jgi:electron transfer flavoprotein beta subunit
MINIVVCVKQVADPEAPPSSFTINFEEKKVIVGSGVPPVINPFDENALESALKIKEITSAKITILSAGNNLAQAVLRKTLAVGADDLILLQDSTFSNIDSYSTAYVLSMAIRKLDHCDLILTGRQAADTDAGVVGLGLAEILGIPSISLAQNITVADNTINIRKALTDGHQVITSSMPALVTVSSEVGDLRTAQLRDMIEAKKKTVVTWNASELGIDPSQLKCFEPVRMAYPPKRDIECQIIKGETPEEAGANLAIALKESGLI